jgi:hypothetical protein
MTTKDIILSEQVLIGTIHDWLSYCDIDVLCRIVEKIFGGDCEYDIENDEYIFTPNNDYAGAFDKDRE